MAEKNVQRVRIAIQWGFLLFSLYLGVTFYRFVLYYRSGGTTPMVARPDGVEAFPPEMWQSRHVQVVQPSISICA